MILARLLLTLASLPVAAWTLYLLLVAAAAALRRPRLAPAASDGGGAGPGREATRFVVLIPAHNEREMIRATVASARLRLSEYGGGEVVVVADNCADETATIARQAGARVVERTDATERGKGFALRFGLACVAPEGDWDALVVVDADSVLEPGFFAALDAAFAQGDHALQAYYTAQPPESPTWRTDLQEVAWSVFNYLRPLGRNGLGGTSPILGNGFALDRHALDAAPLRADSQVEDVEEGLHLLEQGILVRFVPLARVLGRVESGAATARSQRTRWERGRALLAAAWIPRLLRARGAARAWPRWEAALDLTLPPVTLLAAAAAALALAATLLGDGPAAAFLLACLLAQAGVLLLAVRLAGVPPRRLLGLAWLPAYVLWKITLYLRPSFWRERGWVRTQRGGSR